MTETPSTSEPASQPDGDIAGGAEQSEWWGACLDKPCLLEHGHEYDPEGVLRHRLPDDHPVVVRMREAAARNWAPESTAVRQYVGDDHVAPRATRGCTVESLDRGFRWEPSTSVRRYLDAEEGA